MWVATLCACYWSSVAKLLAARLVVAAAYPVAKRAVGVVVKPVAVVSALKSVAHTELSSVTWAGTFKSASVIPTASSVHAPTVTSTIDIVESGSAKVEVVAVWVAGIDAKVPIASAPPYRTIEIGGIDKCPVLPVE